MTDPISDMLTRIRNASALKKELVEIPFSKLKLAISKVLERKGFIRGVEMRKLRGRRILELELKYLQTGKAAIAGLKRVSKPGVRRYAGVSRLRRVKGGYGISIISTSKGVMTDQEAKEQGCGGEILCEVW
ncbi:MAG: 30S ribosomal protein S8 [Parcubacteria group bacterium]|nr:30S ribosomal protein S8 [Parcubacteria group bacterium]